MSGKGKLTSGWRNSTAFNAHRPLLNRDAASRRPAARLQAISASVDRASQPFKLVFYSQFLLF